MYLIYTLILCLLASRGHSQIRWPIKYTYKTVALSNNYTIFDDLNHDAFSPSAGNIVEIKHNDNFQWSIQHISGLAHIIGFRNSAKYIHFPEIKDGAVATLSEDAATLFDAVIGPNLTFNFTTTIVSPSTGPLTWTVEAYSASDPRMVLKLRKQASEKDREEGKVRQDFALKKVAIQD